MDEARRQQLEERLATLDALRARHRTSRRNAPRWLIGCLLCIPAALVWGAVIAFYVMVIVVSMMSLVFYVAWNHEQECSAEQDAIRAMLANIGGAVDAKGVEAATPSADPADARASAAKERAAHDRYRRPRTSSL